MNPQTEPWWRTLPAAVVVVVATCALVIASAGQIGAEPGSRAIDTGGILLGVGAAAALLLRWVNPWLMLAGVTLLLGGYWALGYTGGPAQISGPLAVLSLGLVRSRRETFAAAVLTVTVLTTVLAWDRRLQPEESLAICGLYVGAVVVAELARQYAGRRQAVEESSRRRQAQIVAEQQLGLARDLHDGLAHALTGMTVQASIIERTATVDPAGAAQSAAEIAGAGRAALADLNDIVRSLRSPHDAPTSPERGLSDIPALVDQARGTGLEVALASAAPADPQPAQRESAAYRVVQEALTNAIRHAPGSRVRVEIETARPGLGVIVADTGADGHVPPAPGAGHGLIGMRERVEASGGRLDVGPAGTGFRVRARWEDS
ncbi:sensor histidine kinase [Dermacoccaceae bacterium W4C1]